MQGSEACFDVAGWHLGASRSPSPNCDAWPGDVQPWLVVIHAISLPPEQFQGDGVEALFTNRLDPKAHPYYEGIAHLRVSAHFFIRRDGSLIQFVPLSRRAWHAGVSSRNGQERCNDYAIGIELEGSDLQPFEMAQYHCLAQLLGELCLVLPLRDICGHSDVAPGRKTDPGPFFNWETLRAQLLVQHCDALASR
ncbi:MAG: N-acetylmuramoyl-L-alanine amidase [Candidatus Dactylopiibacterium carminicum]|nr:1,6-anhydro-N-acetylmuramyl-L-alanine amidase AmpD [Candidatus Dactylopiibacterium carminicum]PAS94537.1 MAG: N-acetylmuramoyl-L-alanine amidase [Candidatus Dactylopiibacterium carminicum]